MSKIVSCCATVLLMGCFHLTSLQKKWPGRAYYGTGVRTDYYGCPVRNGCVLFKSNDTLCGLLKVLIDAVQVLPADRPSDKVERLNLTAIKSGNGILNFSNADINFIRLYSDSIPNNKNYIDYYALDNQYGFAWRLFSTKDKASIYLFDVYCNVDTLTQEGIAIVTPKDTVKAGITIFRTYRKPFELMLRFINNRYNQHFKKENFTDAKAMADYILDKEKRLNGK